MKMCNITSKAHVYGVCDWKKRIYFSFLPCGQRDGLINTRVEEILLGFDKVFVCSESKRDLRNAFLKGSKQSRGNLFWV